MASKIIGVSSSFKFDWKIEQFSKLDSHEGHTSDVFSVGGCEWKMQIYPKGEREVYDYLSLYLVPVELTKTMNMEFNFSVTSQTDHNIRVRIEGKDKFAKDDKLGLGWATFMRLTELHDPAKGFIVNDTCVISVEIAVKESEPAYKI
ncbi:hypothetical protein MKX03_033092 [Papaver bracteatum]|nr:hypothetical protein MKX03_033092 [Papaver bracteatum]